MAIGAVHLEWMSHLAKRGAFRNGSSVLDLGPQDVQTTRAQFEAVAARHLAAPAARKAVDGIFDGETPRPTGQQAFYSVFGGGSYTSIDLADARATHSFDLNRPVRNIGTFDIVTNFGTAEHVFDIATAFRSMHDLCKPGGVILHCMPVFGFINHGFYNIHPVFYVELAKANRYEIIDFSYVDNMFVRNRYHGTEPFDFAGLPIRLEDTEDTQRFMTKVVEQFRRNLAETPPDHVHGWSCFIFDLLFVAMRRTAESPAALEPAIQGSSTPAGVAAQQTSGKPSAGWFRRLLGQG